MVGLFLFLKSDGFLAVYILTGIQIKDWMQIIAVIQMGKLSYLGDSTSSMNSISWTFSSGFKMILEKILKWHIIVNSDYGISWFNRYLSYSYDIK